MWLSTWRAEIYCGPKGHKSGDRTGDKLCVDANGRERETNKARKLVKLKRDKQYEFATPAKRFSIWGCWEGVKAALCILSN